MPDYTLKENNPLVADGFDVLECPICDTVCYPDAKTLDNSIIYSLHACKSRFAHFAVNRRFEIDENGDIVE